MNIHTFRVYSPVGFVDPLKEPESWISPDALSLIANAYGGQTEMDAFHNEEELHKVVVAIYSMRDEEANEALPHGWAWIRFGDATRTEGGREGIGIIVQGVVPLEDAMDTVPLGGTFG